MGHTIHLAEFGLEMRVGHIELAQDIEHRCTKGRVDFSDTGSAFLGHVDFFSAMISPLLCRDSFCVLLDFVSMPEIQEIDGSVGENGCYQHKDRTFGHHRQQVGFCIQEPGIYFLGPGPMQGQFPGILRSADPIQHQIDNVEQSLNQRLGNTINYNF